MYKDLLCVQNAKTLSLREIDLSNVLLNYLKCLYIFWNDPAVGVLLPGMDTFGSMKNKFKKEKKPQIQYKHKFDFYSTVLSW